MKLKPALVNLTALSQGLPEHLALETRGRIWYTGTHDSYFGCTLRVGPQVQRQHVQEVCDTFYARKGFTQAPLASGERKGLVLRTYRHPAGGQAQVMITQAGQTYRFCVEDSETPKQRELRDLIERGKR